MKHAFVTRRHSDDGRKFPVGTVVTGMPATKFADFEKHELVREATDDEVRAAGAAAIAFEPMRPPAPREEAEPKATKPARKRAAKPKAEPAPAKVEPAA